MIKDIKVCEWEVEEWLDTILCGNGVNECASSLFDISAITNGVNAIIAKGIAEYKHNHNIF